MASWILMSLLNTVADEFSQPTHTVAIQITSPSPNICTCVGEAVLVAVAAPKVYS